MGLFDKIFGKKGQISEKQEVIKETEHKLNHYRDKMSGFSIEYQDLIGWAIHERTLGKLIFVNKDTKATLVLGFIQLPNVIPDLSDPIIFRMALEDITGSYQKLHSNFVILSTNLVTNSNNGVNGLQLVYNNKISGHLWKGRLIAFFTGNKRYDVTAFAEEESFDAMDNQFFTPVANSFTF